MRRRELIAALEGAAAWLLMARAPQPRMPANGFLPEELVALAPDVILANSTPVTTALQNVTNSVPIVFALTNDPIDLGFAKSLSRPGGNITGSTFINPAFPEHSGGRI
jgi:hypothetical protein